MRRLVCAFVAFFVQSNLVFADSFEETLRHLKHDVTSPLTLGSLCEKVGQYTLEERFPKSRYQVEIGIEYSVSHSRSQSSSSEDSDSLSEIENLEVSVNTSGNLGELDLVVFDLETRKAVLIAEVKCWRNLKTAKRKAHQQRNRFRTWVRNWKNLDFYKGSYSKVHFDPEQFDQDIPFITISQKGGETNGFDLSLDFSLDELEVLNDRLTDSLKPIERSLYSNRKRTYFQRLPFDSSKKRINNLGKIS